mmetsp:Transcript_148450/g.476791  ORF Transcript_148450/g.476791 Transcript_148450/m.476791 type:complete len:101 (-) Transcript_148450:808-1110(-)
MRDLLEPLLKVIRTVNQVGAAPRPSALELAALGPAEQLQHRHEPGLKGRELTKEAHVVSKILMRIGGPQAEPPLRQPWVDKHAGLGVTLLLHAGWTLEEF